jgi:hypothetical protein
MNAVATKERIKERLDEVHEEWILLSIQRILGMSDSDESSFIAQYEANLQQMSAQELQQRAMESEQDIAQGKVSDLAELLND